MLISCKIYEESQVWAPVSRAVYIALASVYKRSKGKSMEQKYCKYLSGIFMFGEANA